jgi:hypothetical protein
MLDVLWTMTKMFFLFGILPTGIILAVYLFLNKTFDIRKSIETVVKNNKAEVANIGGAFVWLCFIGFIIWIIAKLV